MDMTEKGIHARLKSFSSRTVAGQQTQVEPSIPTGLSRSETAVLELKIKKYLEQPIIIKEINPMFANLPNFNTTESSSDDFLDNSHLGKKAIVLDRYDDEFIARLGRIIIPMMVSGFSQRGAGALFVLAYALKDNADGNYVFNMPHDAVSLEDISYDSLPEWIPTTNRAHAPMPNTNNNAEEAQAYSYLAASLLRLFTTKEDNYIGAFNHIVTGYSRFYNRQMPIALPQPTLEGIRKLSLFFSHGGVFKATLFRILYCGGGTKKAEGLRRFLYENHLSNTGMHIWSIFGSLVDKLNCKPAVILSALQSKEYEKQLSSLATMLDLVERSDGLHKRRMWRYGRLFDEAFMLPLQTKNCAALVYILASALKRIAPHSNQNILNITQFKDLNTEKRIYLAAVGDNLIRYLTPPQ